MSIQDGIHKGLSRSEYESIPAVNQSTLKLFRKTAAHAREYMQHPQKPTEAMNLGNAIHCAILEPAKFESNYIVAPKIDRRTALGKAEWVQFEEDNRGKEIISQDDYDVCKAMVLACYGDPVVTQLLSGPGTNELAVVWTDKETGMRCKALLDHVTSFAGYTAVIDLKSCGDASQSEFARSIAKYAYHEQAAFYLDGLNVLAENYRRFFFIAIEKVAPYGIAIYELEDESMKQGQIAFRKHLNQYAECVKTNIWPGYVSGICPIQIPTWAMEGVELNGE